MQSKLKPSQQKSKLIDQIISNKAYGGFEDLVTASVEHVLQEALEGEVTDHLGRQWYQPQKAEHKSKAGYRNGYYPRSAKTSEGRLHFQVPRVRDSEEPFESEILKRLDSLEDRIKDLATEMYVRGLSTRDIEATFNFERDKPLLSRNQVSEIADRDIIWFIVSDSGMVTNYKGSFAEDLSAKINKEHSNSDTKVILIGKDGGIKARASNLYLSDLFQQIDAMPMRIYEIKQKNSN